MDIGSLRLRVQIQTYTETQDATHKTLKTWETTKTVWADIKPMKGLITFDTKQIGEQVTHKVIIRYQPYITTENWLYMNSRRFRIRSVRNVDERNRYLELLCEEDSFAFNNFEAGEEAANDPLRELLG
jgi:SPP1 family predicted phage head-tail adaptor